MSDVRNSLLKINFFFKKIIINVEKTARKAVKKLLSKFIKIYCNQPASSVESEFINIVIFNAVDFHFNLKRRKNEKFSINLYEIDRTLKNR